MKFLLLSLLMWAAPVTNNSEIVNEIVSASAGKKNRIAIYFSGSDWCTNCHQFSKGILSFPEIEQLLAKDYAFYTADFPQRKKLNKDTVNTNDYLAERLNPEGQFPVLVITDNNLNVIAKIYNGHSRVEVLQKLTEITAVKGE